MDRPRAPPSNASPHKDNRPGGDPRNGSSPLPSPSPSAMSRADKFEDEKRRIIQSCFSKKDNDGSTLESYITHIRITEDAGHPSAPAPPTSTPDNKKPRIIIIAVRKSGRVRMHKSRENGDGTFSIGKTWMLDDLSAIQIYDHMAPSSPIEQQYRSWASNLGFVVTITKPYYWHATTPKERDFFIGSLVKIYKKYTGGKLPELIGFDPRMKEALTGTTFPTPRPPKQQQQHPHPPPPHHHQQQQQQHPKPYDPNLAPAAQSNSPQSPYLPRTPSREGPLITKRQPSREPLSSHDQMPQGQPSYPGPPHPGEPRPRDRDMFRPKPSEVSPPSRTTPSQATPSIESHPRRRADALASETASTQPPDHPGRPTQSKRHGPGPGPAPGSEIIPRMDENRRAGSRDRGRKLQQMDQRLPSESPSAGMLRPDYESVKSFGQQSARSDNEDRFVTPLSSPLPSHLPPNVEKKKDGEVIVPPPTDVRSRPEPGGEKNEGPTNLKSQPDLNQQREEPKKEIKEPDVSQAVISEDAMPAPAPVNAPSPGSEASPDNEVHRPGLGPMVKRKESKDLANAFRKAANAYVAFKPRAGGAADRLRAAKEKQSNEPDGITSVVPAPLLRKTNEADKVATEVAPPKTPSKSPSVAQPPPRLQVTDSATGKEIQVDRQPRSPPPTPPSARKKAQFEREDNTKKYCEALGIDSGIFGDRGVEFDHILTDLGWDGKMASDKSIEDLETAVRREMGRVQASSWLGHLQFHSGKLDHLSALIDRTVEECDELDGLLTLYAHELGTLSEDVNYIESQGKGLQTQLSNEKRLRAEIQRTLKSTDAVR
ncbi:hypothetical protein FQN57_000520 [Myotisia sp. PD_48]|nr:hypothetical protein FQN57_000520 [Myotisia sp. PD_48]